MEPVLRPSRPSAFFSAAKAEAGRQKASLPELSSAVGDHGKSPFAEHVAMPFGLTWAVSLPNPCRAFRLRGAVGLPRSL